MKKHLVFLLFAMLILGVSATSSEAKPEFTLEFGHIQNPGHALAIAPAAAIGVIASRGEMRTDLYMWLVLVPVGIFVFARGLQFILQNRKYDMLHKFGQRLTAKYVSHGTKQGERAPMYYVRYSFVADGKEILATSPSLYTWEEALAFRAALKQRPDAYDYAWLADALDRLHKPEEAAAMRRDGLMLTLQNNPPQ